MAVGALAAYQAGSLGVGLSGGGFLIPFILGTLNMLYIELGILKYDMPVAGGSTGAIAATVASGLIPMNAMRKQVASVAEHCRSNANCYGSLSDKVEFSAQKLLSPDAAKRAQKDGRPRIYIALTYPQPLGIGPPKQRLVTNFTSKADLVSAIDASSYIPLWSGPRVTTNFRGETVYDGSLGGNDLPCPPGVAYCLRINSMPAGTSLTTVMLDSISSNRPEEVASTSNFLAKTVAALPGNLAATISSYASGDVLQAVSEIAQFQQMVVAMAAPPPPGQVAAAGVGRASKADIWPGRRHPLPVSQNTWVSWMMQPADADGRAAMFELGRREALSWAQEQGFAAAKGRKLAPAADAYRAAEKAQGGGGASAGQL